MPDPLENTVSNAPRTPRAKHRTRGNQQGTVYQRPTGVWAWQVTLGYDREGRQIRRSGTAKNKTDATRALAQALADHERGILAPPDRITVREFAERWLSRQTGLRDGTLEGYKVELEYALNDALEDGDVSRERKRFGDMKVRDVRNTTIKDLLARLSEKVMHAGMGAGKPMSARTLSKIRTRLRSVFTEAVVDGIVYVNPTHGVKPVKALRTENGGIALDFDQAARLHELGEALYAAGTCRLWPAIFIAVSVGLRRSEVMGLRWQDVDLERGVLRIRHTAIPSSVKAAEGKEGVTRAELTKTDHSRRDILMPSSLKAMFERLKEAQALEREAAGNAWKNSGAVIATETGDWIHPALLRRALENLISWSNPNTEAKGKKRKHSNLDAPKRPRLVDRSSLERRMIAIPHEHRARLEAVIYAGKPLPHISPHDLRHTAGTLMLRRGYRRGVKDAGTREHRHYARGVQARSRVRTPRASN